MHFRSKRNMEPITIDKIPRHKRIGATSYTVDCFSLNIKDCSHYFLSHFHSDHYFGLKRSFPHPVICSITTARLVTKKIGAPVIALEMYKTYELEKNHFVQCIEAYHCPGAVCFIFNIEGEYILHTGDFKAKESFYKPEFDFLYKNIYLDNTYEGHESIISQEDVVCKVLEIIDQKLNTSCIAPLKYEWYFCTYLIGKEKLFLSAAEYLDLKVLVNVKKYETLMCYGDYTVNLLNSQVLEIIEKYNKSKNKLRKVDLGFKKIEILNNEDKEKILNGRLNNLSIVKNVKEVNSINPLIRGVENSVYLKDNTHLINTNIENDVSKPFNRISYEHISDSINVISINEITKDNIKSLGEKSLADRIVIICGTGMRRGKAFHDFYRKDGKVIKKGIEIIYVPYTEHSSSNELIEFKRRMKCHEFINTVKNK